MNSIGMIALGLALATAGCALTTDQTAAGPPGDGSAPQETQSQALTLKSSAEGVTGSFDNAENTVSFSSRQREGNVFEVTLSLRGLTLDGTYDLDSAAASLDGFATENGEDTQLQEEDLTALSTFLKALEGRKRTGDSKALDLLVRATSVWAEHTPTVPLTKRVFGDAGRAWTLLCANLYSYVDGTHDDSTYARWDANASVHALIGDYGTPNTYYWTGSAWTTTPFNHAAWPYEYGDCYGRCGADCGSGHVYSQDCLDHDICVRNGHSLASFWCDDEFSDCVDDTTFAPNCY